MKLIKKLFVLIFISLIGFSIYLFITPNIKIPNFMISSSIKKQFPMEKSYVAGKIILTDPKIHFENDRLFIIVNYENDGLGNTSTGKMTFTTSVKYNTETANLHLDDFTLEKIQSQKKDTDMQDHPVINSVLNVVFKSMEKDPVLEVKDINKLVKIKNIEITNNSLTIKK